MTRSSCSCRITGEMLGDHHLFAKTWPYEASVRVPFLARGAAVDGIPQPGGGGGAGGAAGRDADAAGCGGAVRFRIR